MIRHRSTVFLAAGLAYLGWVLGSSVRFQLDSAIANSLVPASSVTVAQASGSVTQQTPLKLGDRGAPVITLQNKLKQLGYYKGLADGTYSETTKQAVSEFQKSVGLSVTGVLDESTWKRMQKAKGSESKSSNAKSSGFLSGNKNKLLLILGASAALAIAGGGVFLLQRQLNSKKTPVQPIDPIPNTEDKLTTESFSTTSMETESDQTADLESHTKSHANGHTPSYKENFPVEKTTRLSKINIIDELIKDLRTPDPQKRRKAIWELAQQGDSRAVQPLVDLMLDSDSNQRSLILEALSQIGTKTLGPMNRALALSLQDDNPQVRKNAIRDLTQIYQMVAQVSQILCHAADDPDPEVQETARWAMSHLNRIRTPTSFDNLPSSPNTMRLSANSDDDTL